MTDTPTDYPLLYSNATLEPPDPKCPDGFENLYTTSSFFIIPSVLILNILVIGGNVLVIISVLTCRKLRTITNTYVVSLAFADLLLGLLVLPFSGTLEVLRHWPFGSVWCYSWLAIDVFLCTASILSLCAISFDRYLAISRPFKYQTIMSPLKSKLLVAAVWVVAFIVCVPSFVWNERDMPFATGSGDKESSITSTPKPNLSSKSSIRHTNTSFEHVYYTVSVLTMPPPPLYINDTDVYVSDNEVCPSLETCQLNQQRGYVIYSALGSFWIPVWIMAFFYWKIYTIAARTTRGVRRGVLQTRSSDASASSNHVTLRIHRGGSSVQRHSSSSSFRSDSQSESLLTPTHSFISRRNSERTLRSNSIRHGSSGNGEQQYRQLRSHSTCGTTPVGHTTSNGVSSLKRQHSKVTFSSDAENNNGHIEVVKSLNNNGHHHTNHRNSTLPNGLGVHSIIEEEEDETSFTQNEDQSRNDLHPPHPRTRSLTRMGTRFNIRNKLKSFNREKKAAKTVGIIVGCFILCWAPFFTVYLLTAFCTDCTPNFLFTIFFWLGYCNSGINPFVYALFSKDFRFAFTQLLCCRCARRKPTFRDRRKSRFRSFLNSLKIQISSRSSDENTIME